MDPLSNAGAGNDFGCSTMTVVSGEDHAKNAASPRTIEFVETFPDIVIDSGLTISALPSGAIFADRRPPRNRTAFRPRDPTTISSDAPRFPKEMGGVVPLCAVSVIAANGLIGHG
jgi:hypothetical protein